VSQLRFNSYYQSPHLLTMPFARLVHKDLRCALKFLSNGLRLLLPLFTWIHRPNAKLDSQPRIWTASDPTCTIPHTGTDHLFYLVPTRHSSISIHASTGHALLQKTKFDLGLLSSFFRKSLSISACQPNLNSYDSADCVSSTSNVN
jgi:hypothetical protein